MAGCLLLASFGGRRLQRSKIGGRGTGIYGILYENGMDLAVVYSGGS